MELGEVSLEEEEEKTTACTKAQGREKTYLLEIVIRRNKSLILPLFTEVNFIKEALQSFKEEN